MPTVVMWVVIIGICVCMCVCLFVCTIKPKEQKLQSPNLPQGESIMSPHPSSNIRSKVKVTGSQTAKTCLRRLSGQRELCTLLSAQPLKPIYYCIINVLTFVVMWYMNKPFAASLLWSIFPQSAYFWITWTLLSDTVFKESCICPWVIVQFLHRKTQVLFEMTSHWN